MWGKNLTRQAARSKAENTAQWAILCQVQMYDNYNRVLFVLFFDIFIDLKLDKGLLKQRTRVFKVLEMKS